MEIAGSVVIVTGASAGIGEATARLAAHEGASVVLAARRTDRIQALAAELPSAMAVTTDLRGRGQAGALVDATLERYGRVDVLVNNAGQGLHLPLEDVDLDDLAAVVELNVYAPLVMMQAVLPAMRRQGHGSIVNISSGTSRIAVPGVGAYAATKAALNMISQVARIELAPAGVNVSVVYPFITATEFHDNLRAGAMSDFAKAMPADSVERVAAAIVGIIRSGDPEVVLTH